MLSTNKHDKIQTNSQMNYRYFGEVWTFSGMFGNQQSISSFALFFFVTRVNLFAMQNHSMYYFISNYYQRSLYIHQNYCHRLLSISQSYYPRLSSVSLNSFIGHYLYLRITTKGFYLYLL